MIEISQEDFEAKVQDIIDGKTTRTKLISELKTDRDTLNRIEIERRVRSESIEEKEEGER